MKKILHLHVTKHYFDLIKSGQKTEEYRAVEKWRRQLSKEYDEVHIYLGYPKRGNLDRVMRFFYRGYKIKNISSEIYGNNVDVFAINLSKRAE